MPEPVVWTIQESLKTAVEAIDGTGTYFFTASTVQHRKGEQQDMPRATFVVGLSGVDRADAETQGKYYWRATFEIAGIVTPSDSLPDDQLKARLWSDIQTAVMADPRRTVSSTEYAIDTQVLTPEITGRYEERVALTLLVEVYFRTSLTDPTSL